MYIYMCKTVEACQKDVKNIIIYEASNISNFNFKWKCSQYFNMSIILLNYYFIWNKYQFMVTVQLSFIFAF